MSVEITVKVLKDFLGNDAKVLALTGDWGVGKTYIWDTTLKANKALIKNKQYSYVSLFGIGTLHDLRMAIFAKSRSIKALGEPLDFENINNNWTDKTGDLVKGAFNIARAILPKFPTGGAVSVALESMAPYMINKSLICLDDLERTTLKPQDILGLISELVQERECKVALVFNADKLSQENKDAYSAYKEKAVDYEVLYAPTVIEAFGLVFQDNDVVPQSLILECIKNLEITNVRILRKIRDVISKVHGAIKGLHVDVCTESINSIVLLCWVAYAPDDTKPRIENIAKWNKALFQTKKENEVDPVETAWVKRFKGYGFIQVADLDIALALVVERGYLEGTGYLEAAKALDKTLQETEQLKPLRAVWRKFHDEFKTDETSFINELYSATELAMDQIGASDLSSSVVLLRQLNRQDLASKLIQQFVETNKSAGHMNKFDLAGHPVGGSLSDPEIREIFQDIYMASSAQPTLAECLPFLIRERYLDDAHTNAMLMASVEEYEELFLSQHGERELATFVKECLKFSSDEKSTIALRATEALDRIKKISALNALRVARYGI